MSFSNLIPLLVRFFLSYKDDSKLNSQVLLLDTILINIKKEISWIILKAVVALVAAAVFIYALINLGQYFHAYLLIYENGQASAILFYCTLSVISVFIVFKLFYEKKTRHEIFDADFKKISSEKIFSNFVDGFISGMKK